MNSSSISRRHILATLGATSLAGCVDSIPFGSDDGIRLGSLRIANTMDELRTIDLQIERNGDFVRSETIELDAEEGQWIDPSWSSDPAAYHFYYVVAGTDELQVGYLDSHHEQNSDGDCLFADLWIVDGFEGPTLSVKDVAEHEEAMCNF